MQWEQSSTLRNVAINNNYCHIQSTLTQKQYLCVCLDNCILQLFIKSLVHMTTKACRMNSYLGLPSLVNMIEDRRRKFMDRLSRDLCNTFVCNSYSPSPIWTLMCYTSMFKWEKENTNYKQRYYIIVRSLHKFNLTCLLKLTFLWLWARWQCIHCILNTVVQNSHKERWAILLHCTVDSVKYLLI